MEKYLEYSNDVIKELTEKYTDFKFLFRYYDEMNIGISVFFVEAKAENLEKDESWMRISEKIALQYQPKLQSVYEKWNLYIIYLSSSKVSKDLKNKIENDKFSSRKIVEDLYTDMFNNEAADKLVTKHITNSDLKELVDKTTSVAIDEYAPIDSNLWALINNEEKLIGDRSAQESIINKLFENEN